MSFFTTLSANAKASLLALLAGVIYLIVGYMYAKVCYAAPTTPGGVATILEVVTFIPAIAFTVGGLVVLGVGTANLIKGIGGYKTRPGY